MVTAKQLYTGVVHEFVGMNSVVANASEARDFAVAQIAKALGAQFAVKAGATDRARIQSPRRKLARSIRPLVMKMEKRGA